MNTEIFQTKELLPSNENIYKAFQDDTVNRVESVFLMYEMINRESFSISSISLDGAWGSGKTFFVHMLIMLILAKSEKSKLEEEYKKGILNIEKRFSQNSINNFITPIYYDSWKNDSMSEPVISLLYTMCKQTNTKADFDKDIEDVVKSGSNCMVNSVLKHIAGIFQIPDLTELKDLMLSMMKKDTSFIPVFDTEKLSENINKLLKKIATKPLVVFIDELDRCKPLFAIKLLESIKHYFTNDKILFVFSVNIEELQHSIKCIYGQGFDAIRYLDRFFNIRFNLPALDKGAYLEKEYSNGSNKSLALSITEALSIEYNLELREINKLYSQVAFIVNFHRDLPCDSYEYGNDFIRFFFIPVAIVLKFVDTEKFNAFMTGKGADILTSLINYKCIKRVCLYYLVDESANSDNMLVSSLLSAYKILFKQEESKRLGKCDFFQDSGDWFARKVGLLA